METGEKEAVTPAGSPDSESRTAPEKPLKTVTVIWDVPERPWTMESEDGLAFREKSGVEVLLTSRDAVAGMPLYVAWISAVPGESPLKPPGVPACASATVVFWEVQAANEVTSCCAPGPEGPSGSYHA